MNPVPINVLANDTAPAGSRLFPGTLAIATAPKHGVASVNVRTGEITYTAKAGFGGTDSFRYRVTAKPGGFQFATVTVVVNHPTAADDWTDTDAGNPVDINVLANDTDPDGNEEIQQPGSVKLVSKPAHGTAVVDPTTNIVTYTPAAAFSGTDTFATVTDAAGQLQHQPRSSCA